MCAYHINADAIIPEIALMGKMKRDVVSSVITYLHSDTVWIATEIDARECAT